MAMVVSSVLVVCIGNICRSPVGERLLARALPGLQVGSAGLQAVRGAPADAAMTRAALAQGLSLDGHVARQFTEDLARGADLILVMEQPHRQTIARKWPALMGRTMLFGQWLDAPARDVPDPYLQPDAVHRAVLAQLEQAAQQWAQRLSPERAA